MRTVVKVNAKLSLCLIKQRAKETYGESSGIAPYILHLGNRNKRSALCPDGLTRDGTHNVGDGLSPKDGLREKCVPMPGIAR